MQINYLNGGGQCAVTNGLPIITAAAGVSWAAARAGMIFTVKDSGGP